MLYHLVFHISSHSDADTDTDLLKVESYHFCFWKVKFQCFHEGCRKVTSHPAFHEQLHLLFLYLTFNILHQKVFYSPRVKKRSSATQLNKEVFDDILIPFFLIMPASQSLYQVVKWNVVSLISCQDPQPSRHLVVG